MRCTITPISGVRCPAASVHRPPLATARRLQPAASGVRRLAASKGGDDGWLSWDDAPEMPRATNGAPAPANGDGAGETEWGDEVQSLADSLRSGQVGGKQALGSKHVHATSGGEGSTPCRG